MSRYFEVFPAIMALVPAEHETDASDLNPAAVVPGGVNLNTVKIVVAQGRVFIGKDESAGPVTIFAEEVDPTSVHIDRDKGYLTTTSGRKLAWIKDNACGCGSRLRSWRPYRNVGSVSDPTA